MKGSQEQFESLLAPLLDLAFGMALNFTGNRADAEDLVQEAALRAFRGFETFRPGTNFKAWFFRILTNTFLSRRRRDKRRPVGVDLQEVPDLYLFHQTAAAGLHDRSSDPARLLLDKLGVEAVQKAVSDLPDEFRTVATLYFMEDFSYAEIAEVLEIPVGTVRSRIHRGRRLLQKRLWAVAEEEGIVRQLADGGDHDES